MRVRFAERRTVLLECHATDLAEPTRVVKAQRGEAVLARGPFEYLHSIPLRHALDKARGRFEAQRSDTPCRNEEEVQAART